jgi:hypothetical protein
MLLLPHSHTYRFKEEIYRRVTVSTGFRCISGAMSDLDEFVTQVNPNDVLSGRGSGPNDHEGNIKFREMVAQRKNEYMSTGNRQTKKNIAQEIVNTVLHAQGRFLKKIEGSDFKNMRFPMNTELYQIVDRETAMEKTKQALRQNREKREGEDKPVIKIVSKVPTFVDSDGSLEPLPIPRLINQIHEEVKQENQEYDANTSQIGNDVGIPAEMLTFINNNGGMQSMIDSFQGMSTGDLSSTGTIGTIDQTGMSNRISGMSVIDNMSISSIFTREKESQSKFSLQSFRISSVDMMSIRTQSKNSAISMFSSGDRQNASGANATWTLNEGQSTMGPPQNRDMTSNQIAEGLEKALSQDCRQESASRILPPYKEDEI